MGRPQLTLVSFSSRSIQPRFLNSSRLPLEMQSQLSDVMHRFDRVMLERPELAGPILKWADRILRMFNA